MRLTKGQREAVRLRFDGRCAYCGEVLGERWHADHLEPIERELVWVRGVGPKPTGRLHRPENDHLGNLMPACPPCNIDKHNLSLESWRRKLQDACGVLTRNLPTYRHAVRFGLVQETGARIVFYFERVGESKDSSLPAALGLC